MGAMEALFAVQEEDTNLRQLQHRHEHLPEAEHLAELKAAHAAQVAAQQNLAAECLESMQRQKRYEQEVAAVEARIADLAQKLYGGMITSPKDASSLGNEITLLKERQDGLEEKVLEYMEILEPLNEQLEEMNRTKEEQEKEIEQASAVFQKTEAELLGDKAAAEKRRDDAAEQTDPGLLARYEGLRRSFGASVIVHFDGHGCQGCPTTMPAMEADRFKGMDEGTMSDCNECGRLVVR